MSVGLQDQDTMDTVKQIGVAAASSRGGGGDAS